MLLHVSAWVKVLVVPGVPADELADDLRRYVEDCCAQVGIVRDVLVRDVMDNGMGAEEVLPDEVGVQTVDLIGEALTAHEDKGYA